MIFEEYMAQFPVFTAGALSEEGCDCELRYDKSLVEETFDRIEYGTVKTTEPRLHQTSVLTRRSIPRNNSSF